MPFEVGRGDVVEEERAVAEVAAGEAALDPALAAAQPVEHGEQFVAGDGAEAEQGAEGGGSGLGGEAAGGGELGGGVEDAGGDGGEGEVAGAGGGAVQDGGEAELVAEAEDGGDMAVGEGAADGDGLVEAGEGDAAFEESADAGDGFGGEPGEVGEGFLADALAFAPGLAEEDGGLVGAVGDDFDVERHGRALWEHYGHRIRAQAQLHQERQEMFLQAMLWEQNARYGALEMVKSPLTPKGYRPIGPVKFSLGALGFVSELEWPRSQPGRRHPRWPAAREAPLKSTWYSEKGSLVARGDV